MPDKLLLAMHNLCSVRPETSMTCEELSNTVQEAVDNTLRILSNFEKEGYVKSLFDTCGKRRFYLTGNGILRVCSSFT